MTYLAIRRRRWRNLVVEPDGRFAFRVRAVRKILAPLVNAFDLATLQSLGTRVLVQTHIYTSSGISIRVNVSHPHLSASRLSVEQSTSLPFSRALSDKIEVEKMRTRSWWTG